MEYNIPKDVKLERMVLSQLMIDDKAHLDAMPVLKLSEMFFDINNRLIFEAIQDLSFKNKPIDFMTVGNRLTEMKKLENVGGISALVDLTNLSGSAAHIEEHCEILSKYWMKRRLIVKSDIIKQMAFQTDSKSIDILELDAKLNDEISEIIIEGGKFTTYPEALDQVEQRVEMLSNQKEDEFSGVPTGFRKLDRFTGGWQDSDLIIIAARPGMGKTAFILKGAVECGLRNIPVGFFSLEMSIQQLAARTVSINSNFPLQQLIRDGFTKDKYFKTLRERTDEMRKFPIYIDDTPSQDIRDIIAKARIWKRKHGIRILFLDYIQLAGDKSKGNNREQEISSISRNLKMLAKELNIPVIALSQLSRAVETRVDKRPRLSDLRESGAIEQDADVVTFLYRENYYNPDAELPYELTSIGANAEFSFAKYRSGSLETKGIYFDSNKVKYSDPEEHNDNNNWLDEPDNKIPAGNTDEAF